nr:hypothetical protein [Tanacetum cinerariifolium]
EEYDTWEMKMEYWIMNTDHNLQKIIQNRNIKKSLGRDSKGGIIILPPNEHEAKNKTEEGEQVYGLMAGFKSDFVDHAGNASGSVYDAAAEFAMMGISPKQKAIPGRFPNEA